ncbi:MAG: hypothetical protein V7637_5484 [Mycobacteriales bacterium]|jgi:hypothetical protein
MAGFPYTFQPPAELPPRSKPAKLLVPALLGAAVAVVLGVYGRRHHPGTDHIDFGFSSLIAMKVWFATGAGALAVLQLLSALWMWHRLPFGAPPAWIPGVHRTLGTLAFLVTLPVGYACLYSLGFQQSTPRVLAHSLFGCAFYGAFATKLIVVRLSRLPGWSLPIVGGLLFTALIGVVSTSAIYTFAVFGSPGF